MRRRTRFVGFGVVMVIAATSLTPAWADEASSLTQEFSRGHQRIAMGAAARRDFVHDERLAQQRREQRQRFERLTRWVTPLPTFGWSAGFGASGSMWASGQHTGQDFVAPYGSAVRAAHRGTVVFAGWGDRYGNLVEIEHPDGSQTWYAHLSSIVRSSGSVRTGEVIGHVGCTGNCFGTHLHFEVRLGPDEPIDPVEWLRLHDVDL